MLPHAGQEDTMLSYGVQQLYTFRWSRPHAGALRSLLFLPAAYAVHPQLFRHTRDTAVDSARQPGAHANINTHHGGDAP